MVTLDIMSACAMNNYFIISCKNHFLLDFFIVFYLSVKITDILNVQLFIYLFS